MSRHFVPHPPADGISHVHYQALLHHFAHARSSSIEYGNDHRSSRDALMCCKGILGDGFAVNDWSLWCCLRFMKWIRRVRARHRLDIISLDSSRAFNKTSSQIHPFSTFSNYGSLSVEGGYEAHNSFQLPCPGTSDKRIAFEEAFKCITGRVQRNLRRGRDF